MSKKKKLQDYLELAEETQSLAKDMAKKISYLFKKQHRILTIQERLLIGLALKMYYTFESLVEDAKKEKAEAIHHLKTLVESFIYLSWAGRKIEDDKRARIVLAKTCNEKVKFFKNNRGYPGQKSYLQDWEAEFKKFIKDIKSEWDSFKNKNLWKLAMDAGLKSYYHRIYRLACESAHITNLVEYMPLPNASTITFDKPKTSILWVHVALYYGLHIMCDLLQVSSEFYRVELNKKISDLKIKI
jgi:hypothetical protein